MTTKRVKKLIVHELPNDLDPAFYDAIGRVAAKWTLLEVRLQAIIWHYMGLDLKKGRVLTFGLTATSMLTLLETVPLRWIPDPGERAEVEAFADRADTLRKRRNDYVHGIWAVDPADPRKRVHLLYFNSGERKIIAKRQHTQPKNVLALANDIDALQTQVIAFLKRIGAKFV